MTLRSYSVHRETGQKWFPRIPDHWSSPPLYLRYQIELGKMLDTQRIKGESLLLYLRNTDVQWDRINVDELPTMDISPNEYARYTLRYGDLLVCEGGEVGRAAMWTDQLPLCAYQKALHRVRPRCANELPRFLYYTMSFAASTGMFIAQGNPNTIPHLTGEALRLYRLPCPPAAEQAAIVAFLDRETAKIDALVAEQERLITLLREKRQAVISHAVTKGLNPDAPMKASGVEWLGDVPAHWSIVPLKRLADVRTGVAKGKDNGDRPTITVPYLRVANVQDGYLDLETIAIMDIPEEDLGRLALRRGDVLMNEGGDFDKLGRGHVWDGQIDPCITQNHVFAVRPRTVSSNWLNTITGSDFAQFYFMTRSKQSTNLASISSTNLMELPVILPPVHEQAEILEFIATETLAFGELSAEAERSRGLLLERRATIITAAVTGQIDVRHLASVDAA